MNTSRRRRAPSAIALAHCRLRLSAFIVALLILAMFCIAACGPRRERLQSPVTLNAPYDRPQLWAVAPFVNESGVSIVKSDRVADIFAEQCEEIEGVSMVPVNRVLAAMRKLQLQSVSSPADAKALINALGVDGLIVGTVTSYDPYPPPKMGAAVQLFHRDVSSQLSQLDPVQVTRAANDRISPGAVANEHPIAQASGLFDASNHQTLMWLEQYAAGRTELNSAYGTRIYLVNMELYTQFVAYRLLHDLLAVERARVQPEPTQPTSR
jgi:hypothetical protein